MVKVQLGNINTKPLLLLLESEFTGQHTSDVIDGAKQLNIIMIEVLPSAGHFEKSFDIPDSVTGALTHTVLSYV